MENRLPVGRTHCPNPSQRLLAFSRSHKSQREPAPPGEDRVPCPYKAFSIHVQPLQIGDETGDFPGRHPHGVETPWLIATHQPRVRDPVPPREDKVPAPHHESFHTCTTPTNRGRKRWSPGLIQPRTVWKPQLHLQLAKPQPGVVDPAPPGEDKVTSTAS